MADINDEVRRKQAAARGFLGFDALYQHAVDAAKEAMMPEVSMFNEAGSVQEKLTGIANVFRKSPPPKKEVKTQVNNDIPSADPNEFEKRAKEMLAADPNNAKLRQMIEDTRKREFGK